MAYIYNDPTAFADEIVEGFVAAYPQWVTAVAGGVVRSTAVPDGQVAVVIGGGSGHYPAFAGLVGPGLAHGAAMGNIFASPSAHQVLSVARAAHGGGGVLFTYGNYAGDVLNFTQAQDELRDEGIECTTVLVTDDIASADSTERAKRRGIAGDLFVFKTAAAAAEEGKDLSGVAAVAARANEATRTLGVAFTGCTLPGSAEPLFTVPPGRMGVGMGIHGEPGIDELDIPSADGLAELLVHRVLAERPDHGEGRATVLLNGLGAVKYEELFVLYRSVDRLLRQAGMTIIEPDIGELVTSFQMAGVSLTVSWLDDELERLWRAPANTPAYRKGGLALGKHRARERRAAGDGSLTTTASRGSRAAGSVIVTGLQRVSQTIDCHVDRLGELDAIAGDGDHGIGMQRGAHAAVSAATGQHAAGAGAGSVLTAAADAWADRAGGTSGALWGALLRAAARVLGDVVIPDGKTISEAIETGVAAVQKMGNAEPGDKTMVDVLVPFAETFASSIKGGSTVAAAFQESAGVAETAAQATADLLPRLGRARPHAEKSVGTPDPGAVSCALIAQTLAELANEGADIPLADHAPNE